MSLHAAPAVHPAVGQGQHRGTAEKHSHKTVPRTCSHLDLVSRLFELVLCYFSANLADYVGCCLFCTTCDNLLWHLSFSPKCRLEYQLKDIPSKYLCHCGKKVGHGNITCVYVCVCAYVCVCVYACVCVCVCVCMRMYVCMHAYMCVYVSVHAGVYVCVYACVHACMGIRQPHLSTVPLSLSSALFRNRLSTASHSQASQVVTRSYTDEDTRKWLFRSSSACMCVCQTSTLSYVNIVMRAYGLSHLY